MRLRSMLLTLILCGLLMSGRSLSARGGMPQSICEAPAAQAQVAATSTRFDYAGACMAYQDCIRGGELTPCQLDALKVLLEICPADDGICQQTAILYTASIQSFLALDVWGADLSVQATILGKVVSGLTDFQRGDYAAARDDYDLGSAQNVGSHMLALARAVADQAMGKPADALPELNAGLNIAPADPLLHLVRAQVFVALGDTDQASIDAELLRQYTANDPERAAVIAPLIAPYPFDQSKLQSWLLYPVKEWGSSPGGSGSTDQSQDAPRPILIALYHHDSVLLAVNLQQSGALLACYEQDICPNWIVLTGADQDFDLAHSPDADTSLHIHLNRLGDVWVDQEDGQVVDGSWRNNFLLAPAGAPDPRADLEGERCGVISRLQPGMLGVSFYETFDQGTIPVYAAPSAAADPLTMTSGYLSLMGVAECHDNVLWWPVKEDTRGTVGWTPENDGSHYLLTPPDDRQPLPFYCPGTPETHLWVGADGVAAPGLGANNLRAQPDPNAAVIGTIPAGGAFTVTAGAVCAGGFAWWQVDYQGTTGWTAEGQGDTYWLAPQ